MRVLIPLAGFTFCDHSIQLSRAGPGNHRQGDARSSAVEELFPKPGYSPYAGTTFPTRPLFGDTHLHTSQSFDAIAFGNFLGPEEAYRFARGEEVLSSTGQRARLAGRSIFWWSPITPRTWGRWAKSWRETPR